MIVKIGKNEQEFNNMLLERAVNEFCNVKAQIEELNERLSDLKDEIVIIAKDMLEGNENTTISFLTTTKGVKISFGWKIELKDGEKLKALLGDNFDLLVTTDIVYKPEKKLKELALNDDGLKECLEIKEKAPSVSVI
ncbi:hypothetical protein [Campylobacter hyointestinalis]|uniref:hypothetical protein n=1 Tax=Campylobacter hyointestinalis TaxID=198 RepID=UPI000729A0D9|nr:hypothetical protein [Campylobacter hyointestinalis]CUU82135.1 Uncharacterised protein [Campylobacter hyointestinalis subsp. hyointestinalis]